MIQNHRRSLFVCLVSVLALLAGAFPLSAVSVEEIPSPRPTGWSVDLTGTVPAETLRAVNDLGDQIKAANGAEIAVIWIDTTGGEPSHDFAVRLANHWGIGEKDKDNGVLLLAALNDRSADIVLGRGLDSTANNQASQEIMQGIMVPRFRAGDPGGALLEGARACARRILDVAPPVAETAVPPPPVETAAPTSPATPEPVPLKKSSEPGPVQQALGCLILTTFFAFLGFCLAAVVYFLSRPPRCSRCRIPMRLVGEQEDDAYLTPTEKTEERVGSVNYKIWLCPQCGESRKKFWLRLTSSYSKCTSCSARAVLSKSWVLENPTYSSSGTRRVDTACAHCGRQESFMVAIPPLERPRPASSSRRSSSSSSFLSSGSSRSTGSSSASSSSSSSSSRSSGSGGGSSSGYSGGSSSGGGASGSW
jgi:uncharacterized protein